MSELIPSSRTVGKTPNIGPIVLSLAGSQGPKLVMRVMTASHRARSVKPEELLSGGTR